MSGTCKTSPYVSGFWKAPTDALVFRVSVWVSLYLGNLLGGGTAEIGSKACATHLVKKCQDWVDKMAQLLGAIAAKPDDKV